MHVGRDVCVKGEENPRDSVGLRDGSGEGDEEGHREQLGDQKGVEMMNREFNYEMYIHNNGLGEYEPGFQFRRWRR